MNYSPLEQELYEEAMRTVPGMLAAMERKCSEDGRYLLSNYMREGMQRGVEQSAAWSIIFTATLHWVGHLAASMAENLNVDRQEIAESMAEIVVDWQCNGALRG